MTKPYLLIIWNNVEPQLMGPFTYREERDNEAFRIAKVHGPMHGYFKLNEFEGEIEISTYSNALFEKQEVEKWKRKYLLF